MTLPNERYLALYYTHQFLIELLDPKHTPRVSKEVRLRARSLLKHYPFPFQLDQLAERVPEIISKECFVYSSTKKKRKIVGK